MKRALDGISSVLFVLLAGSLLVLLWTGQRGGGTSAEPGPAGGSGRGAGRGPGPTGTLAAIPAAPVSVRGAAFKGSPEARAVMIVYSDFDCPYCGKFASEAFTELDRRFVATGQVRVAFRHFPLESIHPTAVRAGAAAECAGQQGKFWPMHDVLFQKPKPRDEATLQAHARSLGLDLAGFDRCVQGPAADKVRADATAAAALGITGTPTFFIGTPEPGDLVRVTQRLSGAQPVDAFVAVLEPLVQAALRARAPGQ